MAGTVKAYPLTGAGDPEILPWATTGTTLEPNLAQEGTGWQPYGVGPPPDYRLENYARSKQSDLNARSVAGALFVEYVQGVLTLAGNTVGVGIRQATVAGVVFNQTDLASLLLTCQALAAQINADLIGVTVVNALASTGTPGIITLTSRIPGSVFTLAVAVVAGAGTITISTPVVAAIVRGDTVAQAADLVIGSEQADDVGTVAQDARIVWRKAKGAFRAGSATGTQWDDASTGAGSTGLGEDCIASNTDSHARGAFSQATGARTVADGSDARATGADSHARGTASRATAADSHAYGSGANASGVGALALGLGADAAAVGSSAIGAGSVVIAGATDAAAVGNGASVGAAGVNAFAAQGSVTGLRGVAVGFGSSSTATDAAALGPASVASQTGATALGGGAASGLQSTASGMGAASGTSSLAVGERTVANNTGACATGTGAGAAAVQATGIGSRAHGYTASANSIVASGNGAQASGYVPSLNTGNTTAAGVNSRAHGEAALATQDFTDARGYGSTTGNRGESVAAAGQFTSALGALQRGSAQGGIVLGLIRTTDATANVVLTPGAGASTFVPLADTVYLVDIRAVAKKEAVDDYYAAWKFTLTLARVAGVLTVKRISALSNGGPAVWDTIAAGNPLSQYDRGTAGGTAFVLRANVVADALVLQATGEAATNVRWSASLSYDCVGQSGT